jgi:hypothetical protein
MEVHEYNWPESGDASATLAIVAKDGSVRKAIAVWLEENAVHYITPEDATERIGLDSIDLPATRRVNAEKHLLLPLPAAAQPSRGR